MSLAAEVWQTLSAINVNDKVEYKNRLAYLSWAWAWQKLMEHYPESTYTIHDEKTFTDHTMEVGVTVTVKKDGQEISRYMWLPVIDHKNNAIKNPDAFAINKNKMRCLVKCLAMFGLGVYIYAGEDIPEAEKSPPFNMAAYEKSAAEAETMEKLKELFAEAWSNTGGEQRARAQDIYNNRKADFEAAEKETQNAE
ncbi:DUF1071 domain-containing protein [Neisseria meningitidis]|uniref:SSAP RNA binding domain-containing protein n=1 Tax=Neisseria meningitidis serogroup B (strain ATCC 13091 / M2091) TaxID=862513 RepID=E0N6H9_NEIM3|nr:DUF1071 domain-containing protein [Neisseria meningitidis]EFM05487.1 hypothetical protein HMPREF0602_0109 [Neisseria meningitidis ATCC 13091]EJU72988.1 hypothetical protein NMEN80179_0442 [Neisseria meningitidis 80179]